MDVNGRRFEATSLSLILASMAAMSLETLPGLDGDVHRLLFWIEMALTALFTVEFGLRVFDDRRYPLSGWGLIDILALAPAWLGLAFPWAWEGSQTLRILRLVRVFKLAKFGKMGIAARALGRALIQARAEIAVSFLGSSLLIYLSSMLVFHAERVAQPEAFKSVFHAMWWSVATMTTVGYGDMYPVTATGKAFATLTMVIGIGMFGAVAGIMTSVMLKMADSLKDRAD